MDHGQGKSCETLASVTLPPLPKPGGHSAPTQSRTIGAGAVAAHPRLPGGAIRLPPPTPPPRPSNTLYPSVPRSSNTPTRLSSQSQNVSSTPSTNTSLSSQTPRVEGGQQQNNLFSSLVSTIQQPLPLSLSRNSGGSGGLLAETAGVTESTQNITLFTPRTHRQQNVYVDTPIKKSEPLPPLSSANATPLNSIKRLGGGLHRTHPHTPHMPVSVPSSNHNKSLPTVITQPLAASGGGGSIHGGICKPPTAVSSNLSSPTPSSDSIICGECGKCRCASCRSARPLPKAWICDNKCLCSVESCVDTLTCMCCVKAGLYHCGEFVARGDQAADTHEQEWVDNPCSCSSNNWLARWSCLCVFSLVLPCLVCYPVLKGGSLLAEHAYQAYTRHGCTCPDEPATGTALRRNAGLNSSNALDVSIASSTSPTSAAEDKRLLS